jgi:hypothetical protein
VTVFVNPLAPCFGHWKVSEVAGEVKSQSPAEMLEGTSKC